jgi:hypothetical protein
VLSFCASSEHFPAVAESSVNLRKFALIFCRPPATATCGMAQPWDFYGYFSHSDHLSQPEKGKATT